MLKYIKYPLSDSLTGKMHIWRFIIPHDEYTTQSVSAVNKDFTLSFHCKGELLFRLRIQIGHKDTNFIPLNGPALLYHNDIVSNLFGGAIIDRNCLNHSNRKFMKQIGLIEYTTQSLGFKYVLPNFCGNSPRFQFLCGHQYGIAISFINLHVPFVQATICQARIHAVDQPWVSLTTLRNVHLSNDARHEKQTVQRILPCVREEKQRIIPELSFFCEKTNDLFKRNEDAYWQNLIFHETSSTSSHFTALKGKKIGKNVFVQIDPAFISLLSFQHFHPIHLDTLLIQRALASFHDLNLIFIVLSDFLGCFHCIC